MPYYDSLFLIAAAAEHSILLYTLYLCVLHPYLGHVHMVNHHWGFGVFNFTTAGLYTSTLTVTWLSTAKLRN